MLKKIVKKREYGFVGSFVIISVLTIALMIIQAVMQNGSDFGAYLSHITHPLVLIGNFVPIFVFIATIYLLTGSVAIGYSCCGIILNVFLIVNHYKVLYRDVPFKPADLTLVKETQSIMKGYSLSVDSRIILCTLAIWLVGAFVICFVRCKKHTILKRLAITLSLLIGFGVMYKLYFESESVFNIANPQSYSYYEVNDWNYKGFVYCFVSNSSISTYNYEVPKGYSEAKVKELLSQFEEYEYDTRNMPNIIAIMSEAYFDIEKGEKAEFYFSPNPNFTRLKKEAQYGNIVVPGFAGDTASSEFEFLSGVSTYLINRQRPYVYNTCITKDIYGLPRFFKNLGYETVAIHPGERWFYNRHVVYPYMGFDKFISKDEVAEDAEKINNYVSDRVASKLIIDNYKKHLKNKPDKRYFNFTVTIQNHGPYSDDNTWREPIYVRPDGMSDSLYNNINNYTLGHYDADALLGAVTDYARSIDEPTVVVFFGDHLPHFDDDYKAYDYLGYDIRNNNLEAYNNKFTTPYIIWSNASAKKLIAQSGKRAPVGEGEDISCNFLPAKLFEYTNIAMPPYFAYTKKIMDITEVIGSDYFVKQGEKFHEVEDEIYREYMDYRILQYHNIMRYKKQK